MHACHTEASLAGRLSRSCVSYGTQSDSVPIWSEENGGGERVQHIHIRALPLSLEGPEGELGGDLADEEVFEWGERDLEDQEVS